MAIGEITEGVGQGIANAVVSMPGIAALIKIGQVAGIIVIVYVLFLIVKGIFTIKHANRLKRIDNHVAAINHKMERKIKK